MKQVDRDALEQLDRAALIALVLAQQAQIAALTAWVEALGGQPPTPPPARSRPPFVTPARPVKPPPRPRKQRRVHCARRRATPTRVVAHARDACPACGAALAGGAIVRRRQVLPSPRPPVAVVEHSVRRRGCPGCGRAHPPPLDLGDQVLGHHRVRRATRADVAGRRTRGRLPLRTIRWLLARWHGLALRIGALVGIRKAVAARAKPARDTLRAAGRGSPVVCADETGWRAGGRNGHVWCCGTPTLRYDHDDQSRAGAVARAVLGAVDEGTLGSACSAGDHGHAGPHQRCGVHLRRASHDRRAAQPADAARAAWADAVHDLSLAAKQVAASDAACPARVAARADIAWRLTASCAPSWGAGGTAPQATLCQRIDRCLDARFECVRDPAIPADNHRAERRVRPLVVARTGSGGTRSAAGAETRMARAARFATWLAQGRDPFAACHQTLLAPTL